MSLQLRKWRNAPNTASPISVPNRAPIIGTANALPRSSGGNATASMAFALPMTIAEPSPVSPRRAIRCQSSWEKVRATEPTVAITMPMKKTLACPYLSPSRAMSITSPPSIMRYTMTIHATSPMDAPKCSARVGMDSATGRLDSCTSMYADDRAISTSRRSRVARRGLRTPKTVATITVHYSSEQAACPDSNRL